MSFVGETTALNIKTSIGKTFRIFITEQVGGYWIATILYAANSVISAQNELANSREEAYRKASEWTRNNIDAKADIDSL
ncbi:hypothetical protein [Limnohabitans sp. 15K]|uniref:hypothetical protein n=1 Tax=Limnohabitans sp. 15K TaxID=1100706 RepID=UPI00117B5A93|nr:hypothetical protein [Limnohabitans sp. 15K]